MKHSAACETRGGVLGLGFTGDSFGHVIHSCSVAVVVAFLDRAVDGRRSARALSHSPRRRRPAACLRRRGAPAPPASAGWRAGPAAVGLRPRGTPDSAPCRRACAPGLCRRVSLEDCYVVRPPARAPQWTLSASLLLTCAIIVPFTGSHGELGRQHARPFPAMRPGRSASGNRLLDARLRQ